MAQISTALLLAVLVGVVYSQTTPLPPNKGEGTAQCDKCGEFSNNINRKDSDLKASDISRCTLDFATGVLDTSIFLCECREPNYIGDGLTCDNFDECANATDNCDNNAICTDTDRSFKCECAEGYVGDGVICEDFDECGNSTYVSSHNHTHDPCDHKGECVNSIGSYTCTCTAGLYEQVLNTTETECVDIDECDRYLDNCVGESVCVNDEPSFHCECKTGYREGAASTGPGFDCQNIDECKEDSKACGDNSDCTDTTGSYICTCRAGFTLNETSQAFGNCRDIDECKEDPIHSCNATAHRVCKNTVGSVECICDEGFDEIGGVCENVNECKSKPCDANANCTDNTGGYSCKCNAGFTGDGKKCEDIDECVDDKDDCDRSLARCKNTFGDYSCKCIYGYSGDGKKGNCKVEGGDLGKKGDSLSRAQLVIRVHLLENERQKLENQHEMLLRRCDQQDQATNRIDRSRRAVLEVSAEQAANAELWIVTLQSHIGNLKLQNHALELSCPKAP